MPVFSSLSLEYDQLGLGRQLRAERKRSGLTLRQLAERCGIAAARLSQIESGGHEPTFKQVGQIATALGVSLSAFFPPDRRMPYQIVREADVRSRAPRTAVLLRRDRRREEHHNQFWPLANDFVGRQLEPLLGRIMPVADQKALFCHHHDLEFVSVLAGEVDFRIRTPEGQKHETLGPGDCLLFRSSLSHCLRAAGSEPAETLHVLASAKPAAETGCDWFSPQGAAHLDEQGDGTAGSVGSELALLRIARGWSLSNVAEMAGVSVHRLEQFEQGARSIPLSGVMRLGRLFGAPLPSLIGCHVDEGPYYFLQRGSSLDQVPQRVRRAPNRQGGWPGTFHPLARDFPTRRMFPYLIRPCNAPGQSPQPHEHHGQEFFYVLEGELDLTISVEDTTVQQVLGPGDACYLDSSVPHVARARSRSPYSGASAEVIDVFWCPLGEHYLFEE